MDIRVVTPITDEPITLAEAKVHLRVDGTDEDDLIGTFISAAREAAEHYTGRALAPQTLEMAFPCFPRCAGTIDLEMPPVTSVASIKYTDTAGAEQTLSPSAYRLSAFGARVLPAYGTQWPSTGSDPEAVRVQFEAGYVECPDAVRSAMLLTIGHLYENREDVVVGGVPVELPNGAKALLNTVRVWSV